MTIMPKIKICGISKVQDIAIINRLKPDYIGFVFATSKRIVTPEQAVILSHGLDSGIKAVGVFVNADLDVIVRLCKAKVIAAVQLHGDESEDYIHRLKQLISAPVIKAVRIGSTPPKDVNNTFADFLLFDTLSKCAYGGTGERFNWDLIQGVTKPFFLAGGINADNIYEAAKLCPYCIDVSSCVETDGGKDEGKILRIIENVRSICYNEQDTREISTARSTGSQSVHSIHYRW